MSHIYQENFSPNYILKDSNGSFTFVKSYLHGCNKQNTEVMGSYGTVTF